jgi:hypothetical protein
MATVVITTPCGVPIPINIPTPDLPELPSLPDLPPLFGIWLPMIEPPTICPLLLDEAEKATGTP